MSHYRIFHSSCCAIDVCGGCGALVSPSDHETHDAVCPGRESEPETNPLEDLRERLLQAERDLEFFYMGVAQDGGNFLEETRLKGKIEGVRLALSYVEEMLR